MKFSTEAQMTTLQLKKPVIYLAFLLLTTAAMLIWTTPYMSAAWVAYWFLMYGLFHRKNRKKHVFWMSTGIFLDLAIVLILEFQRDAIDTAMHFKLNFLQQTHVFASTIATALYIPTAALGALRYRGKLIQPKFRTWHIYLGSIAFIFRTLGLILMFSLLEKYSHEMVSVFLKN